MELGPILRNCNSRKPTVKSARGLFSSENRCRNFTSDAIEGQEGSFYAEFSAAQNKAKITSLACLVHKLRHFLEIAYSKIWRCLCPLTASMQFLPPPPSNGNCYNFRSRHAKNV